MAAATLGAQTPAPRIQSEVASSELSTLKSSLHPLAQAQFDAGRVPADTRLSGITLVFSRSAAQQADLDALIAAQQNPASPLFHQWLTPEQFGARFGMAQPDLDKVRSWLEQQGFSVDSVPRSRNSIRFSGTARQAELAFSTEMHYYQVEGARHFAPSTELSVPAAIAPVVLAVRNLNDFRPKAQVIQNRNQRPRSSFTSSQSGNVYFAPGDIATVYDIKPAYASGYTGAGQSIAVVGQSAVNLSDIEAFQSAAGATVKDPALVLMPGTGSPTFFSGDESESDLDLEWSSAIAPGAEISLIYSGANTNFGAFDAIIYAVENKIGNIISVSYGECEPELQGYSLESYFQQATTQGQTIVAASGDSGSTACFQGTNVTNPSLAVQEQIAVSYPASSPNVTGVGGTEISQSNSAYLTQGQGYWAAQSSSDIVSSALQYIPEVAWNDDASGCGAPNCLSASGGGASSLFNKPAWQAGVPGIPTGTHRDVPDIALYSSPNFPSYLYCTSDSSGWSAGQAASCNSGFRDQTSGLLTLAGGTSFATPIFAGMVAIINQQQGYTAGQGLVNPTLYTLAANSATYSSAFHDIVSGNNDCNAGSADCSTSAGFSAGPGYDQVTGLGSVDLNNLANAWPANSGPALIGTSTKISASNTAPTVNVSDNFTISVTSNTGSTIPTGTVSVTVDGGTPVAGNALSANGTFVYTTSFATAGTHQILAQYSGDANHATSTGTFSINVSAISSGSGTIALTSSPAKLTVTRGSAGTETITITPAGGYTGTVLLTFATSNDSALANLCYNFTTTLSNGDGSVPITGASAVATQLSLDTNATDCGATAPRTVGGKPLHRLGPSTTSKTTPANPTPLAVALAGLLLAGFLGRSSRKFLTATGLVALLAVGLSLSACGGNSSITASNPPTGTYTFTVTGTDSATSTITGQTVFTFTIQ
jgi:subtilase family serine protease